MPKMQRKPDKRFWRSICLLLFAIGVAVTGISLAYFTSTDRVTNRVESDYTYSLDIVLTEPKWDNSGEVDAKKSVPGMEIDKDPYVTNYLPTSVYVRLKIDFIDGDGKTVTRDDDKLDLLDYYYNTDSCQINENNVSNVYSRFLSTVYYFTGESQKDHLLTKSGSNVQSSNPYFHYEDGWFYYLDYENDFSDLKDHLKSLKYKERTKSRCLQR